MSATVPDEVYLRVEKKVYKTTKCFGVYDADWDSYCSLVAYDEFKKNFADYIDRAFKKRDELYKYNLCKRIQL